MLMKRITGSGKTIWIDGLNGGWISIKDKLPQSKENVLCFYKFEPESPNVIADNVYFGNGVWMNETDKVTHWMPLPEPPKEE